MSHTSAMWAMYLPNFSGHCKPFTKVKVRNAGNKVISSYDTPPRFTEVSLSSIASSFGNSAVSSLINSGDASMHALNSVPSENWWFLIHVARAALVANSGRNASATRGLVNLRMTMALAFCHAAMSWRSTDGFSTGPSASSTFFTMSSDSPIASEPCSKTGKTFFPINFVGVTTSSFMRKESLYGRPLRPKIIRTRTQNGQWS
mmetsp:Transcript_99485/g.252729  ORF Transcript_99485/g.252729 Transcript_99485/m.252729 type:complete len:203 (+) Transcript_99485:90-698(+)